MNDFFGYLESKGVKDINNLTVFVHEFLQDPSIFFDLTGLKEIKWRKNWMKLWPFLRTKKLTITKRICFNDAVPF